MILVTGGAGFIGSNLCAALSEQGRDVTVCDWMGQDERWRNLAKCEIADIVRPEDLPAWLAARSDVEIVFHMGANSATTGTDIDDYVAKNIRATLDLWNWCAASGTRFIYASSAATYGDGAAGFDDTQTRAALAQLKPLNAYGWSKHLVDRRITRLLDDGAAQPPQWAGLKCFNVYGPNEYHKGSMRSVVQQVWEATTRGEPATLFRSHRPDYEDGGQLRDFILVDDAVDVMCWLLENPQISGLFNLGTGKARSFADLTRAVFDALERPAEIRFVDTPEPIREKYQYFTEARMERLRAAGYTAPFTSLEAGVARYVRDFLATSDPYR